MELKGVILDLDGTLLDSMGVWAEVDKAFLGVRGIPVPEDYSAAVAPMGFQAAAVYTIRRFGLPDRPEALIAEWNRLAEEAYRTRVPLKKGAYAFLHQCQQKGIPLAAATASHEELFLPALRHNGVYHMFDAIVTTGEVERGKGFPDIYEKAAQRLGLPPHCCAVFEDIYAGIQGAKAGGFFTVGVFDPASAHEQEAIRRACDLYIEDFTQLEDFL